MADTTQKTNPNEASLTALKTALEAARNVHFVPQEENEAKVKKALAEAKKLLRDLRGTPETNFFDIDSEDRDQICRCCDGAGEHYETGRECYGSDASGQSRGYVGDVP